jgi:hypothetical protein
MEDLKKHIYDWLIELDEEKAANFLTQCEIDQIYIDTAFTLDSDVETYLFDIILYVPLKLSRILNEHTQETSAIELAIRESGQANGIYVQKVSWIPYLKNGHNKQSEIKGEKITQFLSHEYVNKQIRLMNNSVENNPHLALGISKELIETCCKHILKEAEIEISKDWDIAKLVKETNKKIDLMPFEVENIDLARISISKILSGISNIVHGITELRNSYGTGHGHSPEFKTLDQIYIKLTVSISSELAIFYLSLVDLNKKKVEQPIEKLGEDK